jgi:hypothetical protein
MKSVWTIALALVVALVFSAGLRAADKEVTIKGTITCAKCDLKLADKCHTVIKDKDGTVYWFDDDSGKKNHKKICTSPTEGEVTGTVSTEGDKKIIKVEKIKFNE